MRDGLCENGDNGDPKEPYLEGYRCYGFTFGLGYTRCGVNDRSTCRKAHLHLGWPCQDLDTCAVNVNNDRRSAGKHRWGLASPKLHSIPVSVCQT